MKRTAVLAAAVAGVVGLFTTVAGAQEIETFDSPNQTQIGNGNFQFANPIEGAWSSARGGTITDNPTNITITTNPTSGNAYGTAYHNIFTQDSPSVIDISHSNTLQLDMTINSGDAGPIVDLQDGEGDFWQYYFGYGLTGSGNAPPQYPGETIKEVGNNELIMDIPLSMPFLNNGSTTFDFTQLVLFRLEDDPGTSFVNSVSFNDLSAITLNLPLTWNNAAANNLWDTASSNWNNGSANVVYSDGSAVIFNDANGGAANYAVTLNTTVSPSSISANNSAGNYILSGTGSITGATTSFTKMGTGIFTLANTGTNTYGGGTTVQAGTLVIGAAGALPAASNITITGGTLKLGTSIGGQTLSGLSISGTGTLDIANNHLVLSYGATDPASTIYNLLKSGDSSGAWTGPGIDSSTAALPANNHYGVGFVDGADHVPGADSAPGIALTSGQILIAYALYGDVNLDGLVNATDFAIFGANFNKSITGWDHGDFTYTGLVNGTDFALLGENFGKSANGTAVDLPAADYAALDAFASANGLSLPSVPEPTSLAILTAGTIGILSRRRRQK